MLLFLLAGPVLSKSSLDSSPEIVLSSYLLIPPGRPAGSAEIERSGNKPFAEPPTPANPSAVCERSRPAPLMFGRYCEIETLFMTCPEDAKFIDFDRTDFEPPRDELDRDFLECRSVERKVLFPESPGAPTTSFVISILQAVDDEQVQWARRIFSTPSANASVMQWAAQSGWRETSKLCFKRTFMLYECNSTEAEFKSKHNHLMLSSAAA